MIFKKETSIVTFGDFLDVYHKLRQKSLRFLFSGMRFSPNARVASKWDSYVSASDFWLIPEIEEDWNQSISGDKHKMFEDYVAEKYFKDKGPVKMLSIGCGEGVHERNFAKHPVFSKIVGVDISQARIDKARELAQDNHFDIQYRAGNFYQMKFEESFDVVLFHASLHHFRNISDFLRDHVKPLMKDGGLLVVFEFCGPDRLQWKKSQLREANRLLKQLPKKYRTLYDGKTVKNKVYRPGILRMLMVDPSEAPDSSNLVKGIHDNFSVVEEKELGWNITHLLFKGIAHNFINDNPEAREFITRILREEKKFMERTGENDAIFGVYRK